MLNNHIATNNLERFCGELGLKRITMHGLRHAATELWIDAGATVEDVRRLLGH